jgi:hypothetical protein
MLSDIIIRAARPRDRTYKLSDELGLFLLVAPQGGRWWRFKFRFDRKEQLLSLGVYPEVSLAQARKKRDSMRRDWFIGLGDHMGLPMIFRRRLSASMITGVGKSCPW